MNFDMDSAESIEEKEKEEEKEKKKRRRPYCCRLIGFCLVLFLFSLLASLLCSFLLIFMADLPIWNPISVPSQCKIVSSSVDIRSSKVCEVGLLDYKAKSVFHPFERNNFRCRYDYYWASVFKVEYVDHSGQIRGAWAEAPNEALPSDCRPSFSAAWLTKDIFKVNETYDCWYTLGVSRVNIYRDGFFKCQAKQPSVAARFKRCFILSTRTLKSLFASRRSLVLWRWDALVGVVAGFSTSLLSFTLIGLIHRLKSHFHQLCAVKMLRLKRACFFIAYFSFVGWLAIQYVKRLGFRDIL